MGSKEVVVVGWGRLGASAALWQQLHAYMENRFGSSRVSVTGGASHSLSHPVTTPHHHHHPEPLRQRGKIKSDVQIYPSHFFL